MGFVPHFGWYRVFLCSAFPTWVMTSPEWELQRISKPLVIALDHPKNSFGAIGQRSSFFKEKGRIIFQRFSLWIMGWAHSILQCCKWPMSHLLYSFWDSHWWGNGKISWTFAAEGCPRSRPSKNRDSDTLLHPHARRGGLCFFHPLVIIGWFFNLSSPFSRAVFQKASSF